MKKLTLCLLAFLLALTPAAVFADTVGVDAGAAIEGSFGARFTHDNSSIAYVQDNTPSGETVFRFEFLFAVDSLSFSGAPANFRQTIFAAFGPNPMNGGGIGACLTPNAFIEVIRVFVYHAGGSGQVPFVTAFAQGNFCGDAATGPLIRVDSFGADTNANNAVRLCGELQTGGGNTGFLRFAAVDDTAACTSATYQEVPRTNNDLSIDFVRLGTPQLNGFGAGETATYFMDSYASFRLLAAP